MTGPESSGLAAHDGVEIAYEVFGPPDGEPLLLVMGLGAQMITWHPDFCASLVERGFRVARFDNRDTGLSTSFTSAGRPSQLRMWLRPASAAVYRLDDMADDAVAVLDALGWSAAHVVGMSQGGMIAQAMALRHRDRVRTLTSMCSAPGPRVGQPRPGTLLGIARAARVRITDADSYAAHLLALQPYVASPAYPADTDWLREVARESYERGYELAAVQRQTAAIAASGDRRPRLAGLDVPTLVIHGEADRLIRPVGGRETARAIPGAILRTFPGMGHDLPRALWPEITAAIADLARQA